MSEGTTKLMIATFCCIIIVLILHTIFIWSLIETKQLENDAKPPSDYLNAKNIIFGEKTLGVWDISDYYMILTLDKEPTMAEFVGTGSMRPCLGKFTNGIQIKPDSIDEIQEGDIIAYENNEGTLIVHRVIDVDYDEDGWFVRAKGDNNSVKDEKIIRFEDIKYKIIALVF